MPIWISEPAELSAHLASLSAQPTPPRVGLDTEFVRERTYWPQLALVQIAIGDAILLVDPLVAGMTQAIAPLLADANVVKVMHSASEDLVALKHACGVVPAPLFDTQIAAALTGVGAGVGYQRLVQETLDIALQKGETRSDWLRRPLSPAQLDYAADDVQHLFALHDRLQARLDELGRSHWLIEDCARMVGNAQRDELERWPHLSMRAAQYFDAPAQHRLLRLLRWRDLQARDSDRPRSWVLDNELATLLARSPPADRVALQTQLNAHPKAPRKLGDAVWLALETPLADETDAPPVRGDERDKQAMRRLQEAVSARSAELGLPEGVLASRRWLESLLDSGEWPQALEGWRRGELESQLAPLLAAPDAITASR